ncbi:aspartyl/asparaginyl beta-hydroxylase domain-containing protein [Salisaeta longa]|uniref:aspartyl/asparaginyl beta-hydroxylase domain-containing protein n=1 Tax=Salisaeta longa TaxID=503170 RepID=UPI0003B3860C|nr:aspartyl/asparaginyl beta-hydroxylase domain-containing protein [Salisaeta longa]
MSEQTATPSAPTDTARLQQSTFKDRDDSLGRRLGQKAIHSLDWLFGRFSRVGDRPVHDPAQFPWTQHLEAHWEEIRDELEAILQYREALPSFHDIAEDASTISDEKWKTFFFYGYGTKAEENCARCPRTTELIERVPGMTTAFFSILAPGKHIPAHRGPYKGVLRYHLGLKVPEPASQCRIRIADEVVHWAEGKSLVFDDTYNHEVWNATSGERAILFLDVKRPLPQPLHALNSGLISLAQHTSVVQDATTNQQQWSKRLEEAEAMEQG